MLILAARDAHALAPSGDTRTSPCRPTIACTADLVPPGAFEFEVGTLLRRLGANERQWTFPFLAKLTTARWLQLQVGSNGYTLAKGDLPAQFVDAAEIGGKLHFVDQGPAMPSLSLSATASIPISQGQGYLPSYGALLTGYISKDFGAVHADLNVGENIWRLEGAPRSQEFIALAISMDLVTPIGIMAESYYFTAASHVATRDGGFLFAINHSPKPWLTFDCGGDLGMFPSTRTYSLFVGMSVVPVLLWRP